MGCLHPHRPSQYPNLLLYILDETHVTVTLATAVVLLWTRDAHVLWFSIGALGSSYFAKIVKLLIREKRPPPPPSSSKSSPIRPKKTYGMPSTHSTALSYYHGYLYPLIPHLCTTVIPLPLITLGGIINIPQARFLLMLGLTTSWGLGLWSRKELGYHTWGQIIVGGLIGEMLGMGWRFLYTRNNIFLERFLQGWIDYFWGMTVGRILG